MSLKTWFFQVILSNLESGMNVAVAKSEDSKEVVYMLAINAKRHAWRIISYGVQNIGCCSVVYMVDK